MTPTLLFDMLPLLALVSLSFAATNIDNLIILTGLLVHRQQTHLTLFAGYALGMLALLFLSTSIGTVSLLIPIAWLGFLGAVPVCLGIWTMARLLRSAPDQPTTTAASITSLFTLQIANGMDTVLVFAPLLTDTNLRGDGLIVSGYLVMIAIWFGFSVLLSQQARKVEVLIKIGRWLAPLIMIAVGLYILEDTAMDMMVGG